jgi:hypothetical protein
VSSRVALITLFCRSASSESRSRSIRPILFCTQKIG